ncbi:TPA: hypothetical protein N0F65_005422 [Lagenidium giganteum]|uniref:Uncharacterized protein n=1 Tax=Lagenidium giganteum TaxID=4803 RepID=A0AAV2YZP9_9STRA|nr:TPA: hypothetical protein N0F65_005422 [Lagenidium giganteum]
MDLTCILCHATVTLPVVGAVVAENGTPPRPKPRQTRHFPRDGDAAAAVQAETSAAAPQLDAQNVTRCVGCGGYFHSPCLDAGAVDAAVPFVCHDCRPREADDGGSGVTHGPADASSTRMPLLLPAHAAQFLSVDDDSANDTESDDDLFTCAVKVEVGGDDDVKMEQQERTEEGDGDKEQGAAEDRADEALKIDEGAERESDTRTADVVPGSAPMMEEAKETAMTSDTVKIKVDPVALVAENTPGAPSSEETPANATQTAPTGALPVMETVTILICDGCDAEYEVGPTFEVPEGDWFCLYCQPNVKGKSKDRSKSSRKKASKGSKSKKKTAAPIATPLEAVPTDPHMPIKTQGLPPLINITLLICDGCDGEFDVAALDPPLGEIPEGDWFCGPCAQKRESAATPKRKRSQRNTADAAKTAVQAIGLMRCGSCQTDVNTKQSFHVDDEWLCRRCATTSNRKSSRQSKNSKKGDSVSSNNDDPADLAAETNDGELVAETPTSSAASRGRKRKRGGFQKKDKTVPVVVAESAGADKADQLSKGSREKEAIGFLPLPVTAAAMKKDEKGSDNFVQSDSVVVLSDEELGDDDDEEIILICDLCLSELKMVDIMPDVKEPPPRPWFCKPCMKSLKRNRKSSKRLTRHMVLEIEIHGSLVRHTAAKVLSSEELALRGRKPILVKEIRQLITLVGKRVGIFLRWDKHWVMGRVLRFDPISAEHTVQFEDDSEHQLPLYAFPVVIGTDRLMYVKVPAMHNWWWPAQLLRMNALARKMLLKTLEEEENAAAFHLYEEHAYCPVCCKTFSDDDYASLHQQRNGGDGDFALDFHIDLPENPAISTETSDNMASDSEKPEVDDEALVPSASGDGSSKVEFKPARLVDEERAGKLKFRSAYDPKVLHKYECWTCRKVRMLRVLHRLFVEDKLELFKEPVTKTIAPTYFEVIKCPMDLTSMQRKVLSGDYKFCDFRGLREDFELLCLNAVTFNTKERDFLIWREAWRFYGQGQKVFRQEAPKSRIKHPGGKYYDALVLAAKRQLPNNSVIGKKSLSHELAGTDAPNNGDDDDMEAFLDRQVDDDAEASSDVQKVDKPAELKDAQGVLANEIVPQNEDSLVEEKKAALNRIWTADARKMRKDAEKCPMCRQKWDAENEELIQCDACELWGHPNCDTMLTEEPLKYKKLVEDPNTLYVCDQIREARKWRRWREHTPVYLYVLRLGEECLKSMAFRSLNFQTNWMRYPKEKELDAGLPHWLVQKANRYVRFKRYARGPRASLRRLQRKKDNFYSQQGIEQQEISSICTIVSEAAGCAAFLACVHLLYGWRPLPKSVVHLLSADDPTRKLPESLVKMLISSDEMSLEEEVALIRKQYERRVGKRHLLRDDQDPQGENTSEVADAESPVPNALGESPALEPATPKTPSRTPRTPRTPRQDVRLTIAEPLHGWSIPGVSDDAQAVAQAAATSQENGGSIDQTVAIVPTTSASRDRFCDNRYCMLCLMIGDETLCGRLLYLELDTWVHVNCILWSSDVFESEDGVLMKCQRAKNRGRMNLCDACGIIGASVGCSYSRCMKHYHFPCALDNGVVFLENGDTCCPNPAHIESVTKKLLKTKAGEGEVQTNFEHIDNEQPVATTPEDPGAQPGKAEQAQTADNDAQDIKPDEHIKEEPRVESDLVEGVSDPTVPVVGPVEPQVVKEEEHGGCDTKPVPDGQTIADQEKSVAPAAPAMTVPSSIIPSYEQSRHLQTDLATADLDPKRRVQSLKLKRHLCYRIGALTIHALGHIVPGNPSFHSPDAIYPLGFRSTRIFWSTQTVEKRCVYECVISSTQIEERARRKQLCGVEEEKTDEGDTKRKEPTRAVFKITPSDDRDHPIVASSPNGALVQLRSRVVALYEDHRCFPADRNPFLARSSWFSFGLTGNHFFGVAIPVIAEELEQLPGAATTAISRKYMVNLHRQTRKRRKLYDASASSDMPLIDNDTSDVYKFHHVLPSAQEMEAARKQVEELVAADERARLSTGSIRTDGFQSTRIQVVKSKAHRRLNKDASKETEIPASSSNSTAAGAAGASGGGNTGAGGTKGNVAMDLEHLPIAMQYRELRRRPFDEKLEVRKSKIHGWGLFTKEQFTEGQMIVEYQGEMISQAVADERERYYEEIGIGSCYMFRLDASTIIDATRTGNLARFINHSCDPKAFARVVSVEGNDKKIVIFAKRTIEAGDEVTYDYKFPIEDEAIRCDCSAPNCIGRMN